MADILHDFFINASPAKVYNVIATPEGLNSWWTKTCSGSPSKGEIYFLGFAPEYQWQAVVSKARTNEEFELQMTKSDKDWDKSKVGFVIEPREGGTQVRFTHRGWPAANEHYRISSYCWAMYLRLLKQHVENGLVVPYDDRLDV